LHSLCSGIYNAPSSSWSLALDNYLETWDSLRNAIDQAHSLIDLKSIRVQAEAYRYALKVAGEAPEVVRKVCQIKLRAERRAGELLSGMPKQGPGEYKRSQGVTVQTLDEQGIDKRDAGKWQRIASIPDDEFETWMNMAKDITTAGALQVAKVKSQWRESFFRKEALFREVTGKYAVILADPPWSYDDVSNKENRWGGAEVHYSTLSTEQLCSFRLKFEDGEKMVPEIVEDDSLLFLWTTAPMIPEALRVMEAWVFLTERSPSHGSRGTMMAAHSWRWATTREATPSTVSLGFVEKAFCGKMLESIRLSNR
jgi:hypothetical protein